MTAHSTKRFLRRRLSLRLIWVILAGLLPAACGAPGEYSYPEKGGPNAPGGVYQGEDGENDGVGVRFFKAHARADTHKTSTLHAFIHAHT